MRKEKSLSVFNKFISALIIVMIFISSYGTFLSEVAAAVNDYENQKTETGDRKVSFDAYLKNGDNKVHSNEVNTKDENYIYLGITLQEGIIQNANIKLDNPNFAIDYEELSSNTLINNTKEAKGNVDQILVTSLNNRIPNMLGGVINPLLQTGGYMNLQDVLVCTKIISSSEETTSNNYKDMQNIAEIIGLNIANGRRPYYEYKTNGDGTPVGEEESKIVAEIPGNAYPSTLKNTEELDTGLAETLTFVVPFGDNRQLTLIIISIVSLGILVVEIILIKKRVL